MYPSRLLFRHLSQCRINLTNRCINMLNLIISTPTSKIKYFLPISALHRTSSFLNINSPFHNSNSNNLTMWTLLSCSNNKTLFLHYLNTRSVRLSSNQRPQAHWLILQNKIQIVNFSSRVFLTYRVSIKLNCNNRLNSTHPSILLIKICLTWHISSNKTTLVSRKWAIQGFYKGLGTKPTINRALNFRETIVFMGNHVPQIMMT